MKCIVMRSSQWAYHRDEPPCEGATLGTFTKIEHGKEYPDTPAWFIEINTLEELIAFADKYGDLVLTHHAYNEKERLLEIYDDYRE